MIWSKWALAALRHAAESLGECVKKAVVVAPACVEAEARHGS